MKIKEIHVGLSGVIPVAAYENMRPSYDMTVEVEEGENPQEVFDKVRKHIKDIFDLEVNKAKTDLIERQYENIRFYNVNGLKYPSVTSILGWNKDWKISEDELSQYGSRGTIVHKLIELWIKEKKWINPLDLPELENEVATLIDGSLNLSWKDCSYEAFFNKYGSEITFEKTEAVVSNQELMYCGRYDAVGVYNGKKTLFDFKTGTGDMRQLSAYAMCLEGIEQLCIISVGATKNKCGYIQPKATLDVSGEFKEFVKARTAFKRRFGI